MKTSHNRHLTRLPHHNSNNVQTFSWCDESLFGYVSEQEEWWVILQMKMTRIKWIELQIFFFFLSHRIFQKENLIESFFYWKFYANSSEHGEHLRPVRKVSRVVVCSICNSSHLLSIKWRWLVTFESWKNASKLIKWTILTPIKAAKALDFGRREKYLQTYVNDVNVRLPPPRHTITFEIGVEKLSTYEKLSLTILNCLFTFDVTQLLRVSKKLQLQIICILCALEHHRIRIALTLRMGKKCSNQLQCRSAREKISNSSNFFDKIRVIWNRHSTFDLNHSNSTLLFQFQWYKIKKS